MWYGRGESSYIKISFASRSILDISNFKSSLLALGGKFASINLDADSGSEIDRPTAKYLTGFSSGTGIAGVMGYAYVTVIHFWCGFSFATTLLVANAFAVAYSWIFFRYLDGKVFAPKSKEDLMSIHNGNCSSDLDNSNLFEMIQPKDENHSDTKTLLFRANLNDEIQCSRPRGFSKLDTESINLPNMTLLQKSRLVVSLWPVSHYLTFRHLPSSYLNIEN